MTLNIVFVYYISSVTSVKFLQYETLNVEKYLQTTWYIYYSRYILLLLVYLLFWLYLIITGIFIISSYIGIRH